jgi:hypothetical protein
MVYASGFHRARLIPSPPPPPTKKKKTSWYGVGAGPGAPLVMLFLNHVSVTMAMATSPSLPPLRRGTGRPGFPSRRKSRGQEWEWVLIMVEREDGVRRWTARALLTFNGCLSHLGNHARTGSRVAYQVSNLTVITYERRGLRRPGPVGRVGPRRTERQRAGPPRAEPGGGKAVGSSCSLIGKSQGHHTGAVHERMSPVWHRPQEYQPIYLAFTTHTSSGLFAVHLVGHREPHRQRHFRRPSNAKIVPLSTKPGTSHLLLLLIGQQSLVVVVVVIKISITIVCKRHCLSCRAGYR